MEAGVNMDEFDKRMLAWQKKRAERKMQLESMPNSKSYVPFDKLGNKNRIYYIHDNGGRPFKVVANKKNGITVYTHDKSDNESYPTIVLEVPDYIGYWYGFDSSPNEMHGNSILIKIKSDEYIHIGWEIYKFGTGQDEIIDFISPIGNSDVPYPVAYGNEYVYFMLDEKKIKINDLEFKLTVANAEDLYGEYYGHLGAKKGKHKKYAFDYVEMLYKQGK